MKLRYLVATATLVLTPHTAEARHSSATPVVWMVPGQKGFYHSRYSTPRQSIQVGPMPTNEGFPVSSIVAPWNSAAGWTLFRPVAAPTGAQQVIFKADLSASSTHGAWVQRILYPNGYIWKCVIHYDRARVGPTGIWTGLDQWGMAHEVGHCLGFRDHLNTTSTPGAPQCVTASAPYFSAYEGVMNFCDWFSTWYRTNVWFHRHDINSLYHYSYGLRQQ
jgi:hypothetical protein